MNSVRKHIRSENCILCTTLLEILFCFLQDLERLQLHEALEAETITASAHRHKLGPFAEQIEEEIRGRFSLDMQMLHSIILDVCRLSFKMLGDR